MQYITNIIFLLWLLAVIQSRNGGGSSGEIGPIPFSLIKKNMNKKNKYLTFKRFHETNVARSNSDIKHSRTWIPLSWGGALAGEVGELCNFLKKMSRGDKIPKEDLAYEIADILTYLSLLADKLDIDMEKAVIEKFNIVSKRWGSKFKL